MILHRAYLSLTISTVSYLLLTVTTITIIQRISKYSRNHLNTSNNVAVAYEMMYPNN